MKKLMTLCVASLLLCGCSSVRLNTVDSKVNCAKKNQMHCTYDGIDECCDQLIDNDVNVIIDL
jgi:uncharacterized protein YcfL